MVAEVLDALGIDKIDLVANDSGGAIAQIFAAHHPQRLRSLVLTNCDVHDGWPPPQVLPLMEHSRKGTLAPIFQPTLDRPDLARERYARGESVPLFRSYADTERADRRGDPAVSAAAVVLAAAHRRLPRYWLGFDNAPYRCHSRRAENAAGADADRVGPEGHLLRQEMGLLAERHHPRAPNASWKSRTAGCSSRKTVRKRWLGRCSNSGMSFRGVDWQASHRRAHRRWLSLRPPRRHRSARTIARHTRPVSPALQAVSPVARDIPGWCRECPCRSR